jgi:hypothetical protein
VFVVFIYTPCISDCYCTDNLKKKINVLRIKNIELKIRQVDGKNYWCEKLPIIQKCSSKVAIDFLTEVSRGSTPADSTRICRKTQKTQQGRMIYIFSRYYNQETVKKRRQELTGCPPEQFDNVLDILYVQLRKTRH